jgi:polysaccharide pyruvyl transferase WcaK-like protein
LRPFWQKYIFTQRDVRELQSVFLLSFADALGKTLRRIDFPAGFYFFPMNSDQFGFSDLNTAHQLKALLPAGFPLQIWETEPDVDQMIQFLRRMDVVVAMRFHAAVFALSQAIPVIGIDYTSGQNGKVSRLMQEHDRSDYVCRIDNFNGEWLVERLVELLGKRRVSRVEQVAA